MMVVFLVLLTFVTFILIDWYLLRRRRMALQSALSEASGTAGSPLGLFFHPGHTWVRPLPGGLVSVGASEFALNFAGNVSAVELPKDRGRLRQGETAWTLVSARKRRLDQTMPVEGKVIAVNRDLLRNPHMARQSPYRAGWILCIRPRSLRRNLRDLMRASAAKSWLDATRSRVLGRIPSPLGAVSPDGGEWLPGFGDQLDDADWKALRDDLFPDTGLPAERR
jgi:glycine cleavage system H lipoate-binding protein